MDHWHSSATTGPTDITGCGRRQRSSLFLLLLAYFDIQPLDLLIQSRQRNTELFGSLSLVPVATLQLVDDDAPFNVLEDVEEGRICIMLQQGSGVETARQLAGKHL